MALSAYERQVMLLNLEVVVPEGARTWSAARFFQVIQRVYDEKGTDTLVSEGLADEVSDADETGGEVVKGPALAPVDSTSSADVAAYSIPDGNVVSLDGLMRIADMRTAEDGTVTILLQHADRRAADPALLHVPSGVLRTFGKADEDGLAHGAHLVVQTTPGGAGKSAQVRAILERVPNLGRSSVITFLNMLLRRVSRANQLRYVDPKEGKVFRYNPRLEASQQASASFKRDVEKNRISKIELVRRHPQTGLDEDGISPDTLRLVLSVSPDYPKNGRLGLIERIRAKGAVQGFQEMQIRLHREKGDPAMSPRFAMDYADAADIVYSRMESLTGFNARLEQCPKAIVDDVLSRMHVMLNRPGYWK